MVLPKKTSIVHFSILQLFHFVRAHTSTRHHAQMFGMYSLRAFDHWCGSSISSPAGFLNDLMYFCFIEPPRDSLLWIHPLSLLFYRSLVPKNPSGILAVMQPNLGTHVFHIEPICSAGLILWACAKKKKPFCSSLTLDFYHDSHPHKSFCSSTETASVAEMRWNFRFSFF